MTVPTTEWRVRFYVAPGDVRTRYVIADTREEAIRLTAERVGVANLPAGADVSARWLF